MADTQDDSIDRLLSGDLSAADQRRVAQAALDDPDLFDRLTAAAAVERAISGDDQHGQETTASASDTRRSWPARRWVSFAVAGLASAAAVLALVYVRPSSTSSPSSTSQRASTNRTAVSPLPEPILLAARLEPAASTSAFRTDDLASRDPKPAGTITSVRDGEIEIDLGSLDGLQRGSAVRVTTAGAASIRVTIATAFRERARGRADSNERMVRVGDRVEVPAATQVNAWIERASARQATGDLSGAAMFAREAASRADAPDVPGDVRRRALEQLGVLARTLGDLQEAKRTLSAAVVDFDAAPPANPGERADVLNELGVVQITAHEYEQAEQTLHAADSYATGATKVRVTNNRAALAALRGDRASGESLYREARALAATSPALASERTTIDANLEALVGRRSVPK